MTIIWVAVFCWQVLGIASLLYFDFDRLTRMGVVEMSLHILVATMIGQFLWLQPLR